MPGYTFANAFSGPPPIQVFPDGTRVAAASPDYVVGKIYAYNDSSGDVWYPGTIIITNISPGRRWRAGKLAAKDDIPGITIVGDVGNDPANFATQPVIGVATGITTAGQWGELAVSGIVPVRCRDASSDIPLRSAGGWVRLSADVDDYGTPGVCESISAANVQSATAGISTPGNIIGQIVVPALNVVAPEESTGSNFYVVVILKLR